MNLRDILIVLLVVEDSEDGKEEVDNVEIQADGCGNLLLDVVMLQNKLRIHQDVARKDQSCNTRVCQLDRAIVGEESGHEAKQDQSPETAKEIGHPASEVILRLACEERKGNEDAGS